MAQRNDAALGWGPGRKRVLRPALVLALAGVLGASLGPVGAQVPDTTPPETTITGGPSGDTTDSTPTFTFAADQAGATFECSYDGRPFAPCSLSESQVLGFGPHTFEVRATDPSGNVDPTPALASFAIVLPPPVLGAAVNARPLSGKVSVARRPGAKGLRFVALKNPRQIRVGSFVNARRGTVRMISAKNRRGRTQAGSFAGGVFQVLQSRRGGAKGLTELVLKGSSFSGCRTPSAARAQLSGRALRRLRSNAKGSFRTRGRHAAATVRGTVWTTTDRCDGTLTKVTRGEVVVRDFRRRKTIVVRAGRSYLARAPR